MRVVIPAGVYSKCDTVDVHIATPYGLSPHLTIPVIGATPDTPPSAGYTLSADNKPLAIEYLFTPGPPGYPPLMNLISVQGNFRIDWNEPTGSALNQVTVIFTFKVGDANVVVPIQLSGSNGHFEISAGDRSLTLFAGLLLDALNKLGMYNNDKPLSGTLESATIQVLPISPETAMGTPTHDVQAITVPGKIQVQFSRKAVGRIQAP